MTPDLAEIIADLYNVGRGFERNPATADKPAQMAYRLAEDTLRALVSPAIYDHARHTLNELRRRRFVREADVMMAVQSAMGEFPEAVSEVRVPPAVYAELRAALRR